MAPIVMIATKSFDIGGVAAMKGARLDLTPIQALMVKYQGVARDATDADMAPPPQVAPPPADPVPPRRGRGRYRRKDLQPDGGGR